MPGALLLTGMGEQFSCPKLACSVRYNTKHIVFWRKTSYFNLCSAVDVKLLLKNSKHELLAGNHHRVRFSRRIARKTEVIVVDNHFTLSLVRRLFSSVQCPVFQECGLLQSR